MYEKVCAYKGFRIERNKSTGEFISFGAGCFEYNDVLYYRTSTLKEMKELLTNFLEYAGVANWICYNS